jgi:hypothetical protein
LQAVVVVCDLCLVTPPILYHNFPLVARQKALQHFTGINPERDLYAAAAQMKMGMVMLSTQFTIDKDVKP